jgi:cell cycle sensor histidine kinase DivJ
LNLAPALAAPGRAEDVRAVVGWHVGWSVAALLLAVAAHWLSPGLQGTVLAGLIGMILPGLAGLWLSRSDSLGDRGLVLGVWSLAAVAASALSGGLTGSLSAFVFAPLVAGILLGGRVLSLTGAFAVALSALVGLVSVLLGGAPGDSPMLAAAAAVVTALAAAAAIHIASRPREDVLGQVQDNLGRIESVLAGQPGLTLVMNPDGRVLGAYGTPPPALDVDALFTQGLIAQVHAPDRSLVSAALDRARNGLEAQAIFAPRVALDRRVTVVLRRLDGADETVRLIAQAFDGTPQFARESGLESARAEAEAQNAGKTRFLANMSHELRTPLNAVLGFSDIMRQRLFGPLPDRYADYADSIHEAGGHLLDLINDVLDVSKIEAERYELSLERFDAREVVSAAIALVRLSATDKGVELNAMLPGEPLMVEADQRALKQMTLNLLSNAIKFTPARGSVTLTVESIGPYMELVVADTGVGVAPEDLRRLGRPFEQAGGAEQRAQGTGLGLSLVRALSELHGGRMSIESTLGEGTAVTVRMPVVSLTRALPPEGGAEIIPLHPDLNSANDAS